MGYYYPGAYMVLPPDTVYFITITVIDWVDVFTREEYKQIIVESLDFCRKNKGLNIYAWVIMTNHLHLIVSHETDNDHLERVIGDFKKFTAKKVIAAISRNPQESRKRWMLNHFKESAIAENDDASCSRSKSSRSNSKHQAGGESRSNEEHYHLWQRGYDSYCIYNIKHLRQKMNYLHANPVRAGIVDKPWEYRYCSYRNYCGEEGLFEIDLMDLGIEDPTRPSKW